MKAIKKLFSRFWTLALIFTIIACSKSGDGDDTTDPTDPIDPSTATVAEIVASGDEFENYPPNTTETEVAGTEQTADEDYDRKDEGETIEQRWVCTKKEVDITGGTHTFPLYNTNASVIWPGNLLQGKTLDNATPSDIVVKRAGGKITYNLVTGNPKATVEVDVIDQGTVQQAMNDVIAQNGEITPANFTLDVVAINSREQLALEMGLKASSLTTKVSSNFSLNTNSEYSSVLVKLTQAYYTMSYVKPTDLDEVFHEDVTAEQLAKFIQPNNPATFISSVTYGRIFYMLYESTASAQDMEFALKGSYNAVAGKVSGNVDIESLREYNNLSVKVIAYGGDSEGTLNAVGATFGGEDAVDNLKDIVDRLAASSDISGGLPLSYVVNSLEDPSQVVSTNLATKYSVKNCELKGILPPGIYSDLLDLFEDGIGAMANLGNSDVLVFNKTGTKYAWFNGNTPGILSDGDRKIFDIKDPDAPLGELELESVGAAVKFADNLQSRLYIFDGNGFSLQIFQLTNYVDNNQLPEGPIGTAGSTILVNETFGDSNNFALGTQGIGAGVSVGATSMAFFGLDGDEYQVYNSASGGSWTSTKPSNEWFGDPQSIENNGALFDEVGAATSFTIGGSSRRFIFVNKEGDEINEWFSSATVGQDRFEGPWVIN
ncbi:thiol-activated cytolysin family protein [Muricauda sp. ANG21]|uniref:thiol-activated cytolysin family protein n=1 Tax=Allomuricauda sp. ANG21 TaxID=3042468 RepID=UPI0034556F59